MIRRPMGGLVRAVIATTVVFALTGGPAVALAITTASGPFAHCPRPAQGCHDLTFKCACCLDDGGGAPTPAVPAPERAPVSKTASSGHVLALVADAILVLPGLRVPYAPSTHRAGQPRSLSILHASLLL
jgi:hypothetical protein